MPAFSRTKQFQNARDAWFRGRQEAQKKLRREGRLAAGMSLRRSVGRWAPRMPAPQRTRLLSGGPPTLDPAFGVAIRREAEAIAPAIVQVFDTHLARLATQAWKEWPVASGLSRSLLDIQYSFRGRLFDGAVVQNAPYWRYIQTASGGKAFVRLLRRPGKALSRQMASEVFGQLRRSR